MSILVPRTYQKIGTAFLKTYHRAMLLDQPGLGKTLQAAQAAKTPVLVVCPTYLVNQWADFIAEQFPGSVISVAQGARYKRELALEQVADWYIINTEMLRDHTMPKVTTVIFDESHHLRGRNSLQARQALEAAKKAKYVFELTATPIIKDPDDLYMQLRILYPKLFTSYYDFVEKFCSYEKTPYGNKVHGAKYPDVVRRMLKNFAIGRSYKEAGLELPDLIEHVISVTMPPGLMVRYKEVKTGYVLEDIPLDYMIQVMQILRRMTLCNEKIEALLNTIQDNDAFDAVIFTWYRETAEAIGKVLNIPVITGDMPAETRIKTAKESDMVVATISSLSEGVDLSKSRNVVFFETDYTYGIMHQAVSRVRRYSADNTPINVFYIMMKNTIDETVYRKSKMRGATVKEILREEING